ncbi:kelch-like protein 4 [Adelges cooleyi]|uniref:kelch-like protein 4 n=1 Tax=Adelges cooleyi TaxID=133065 RepID=UPI00217FEE0A|nr:kelch-like protein 4 [Adelges cooleyi]
MDISKDDDMKWRPTTHLFFCPPRKDVTMVVSENGIIIAIGGTNMYDDYINSVDELDLKLKKWVPTSQLIHPRKSFAVCTNKQFIYVVGGYDLVSQQFSNSVEYYDTNTKLWTEIIEPMPTARDSCSAIINNNQLYVFGGYDFNYLATVEYYDFENKYWEQLDPMPIANSKMAITRINNFIYLIGVVFGHTRIFKFDVHHFKWDEIPNMHSGKQFATHNVVNKKNDLIVFINDGQLTCERYDVENKQWFRVDTEFNFKPSPGNGHIIYFNDYILKSYGIHL